MGDTDTAPLPPLRVMADPHRWKLLSELGRSDRRVSELTALLGEPQSLVSYHLGALRASGLVSSRRSSFDGRDSYYRLNAARCGEVLCAAGVALDPGLTFTAAPPPVPRTRPKPRVLFLCTGNSARSQMAEALLAHRSGGAIDARSAGSHPEPVHPYAVRAMAERGIDISRSTSKHFDRYAGTRFDCVVTLCDKVREVCPELPGEPDVIHWSTPDPHGAGTYRAFTGVAADVDGRTGSLIARLTHRQGGAAHGRQRDRQRPLPG